MAQSLCALYVHYIWSTKNRVGFMTPTIRRELHPYIATVIAGLNCPVLEVGGVEDHIHILCLQSKNLTVPAFVEAVKKPTSKWMKTKRHVSRPLSAFSWQTGYAAFSVSASQVDRVRRYIQNQEAHHRKISFQDELRAFLKRYRIDFREEYVWD